MSWQGRRVVVTGAGGFIGSHLVERLVDEGAQVRALVRYNALASAGWLDTSPRRDSFEVVAGDVADSDCVHSLVRNAEIVFHLAALIAIPYSYQAPRSYVRTNVEGTLNVLEACRAAGVTRLVHTSTSEVYGTARVVPISEAHPLQGQSPYSASKIAADKLAEAWSCSFGLPVVTLRPFNTFGPRQSARAVIPTIISQLIAREQVKLGKLTPTRDLNFVDNTVDGFLAAATAEGAAGRVFNVGSGREIAIGDLVVLLARMMGKEAQVVVETERLRPENSEVERLLADASDAARVLGWRPRVELEEGLRRTIEWTRQNADRYRAGRYER